MIVFRRVLIKGKCHLYSYTIKIMMGKRDAKLILCFKLKRSF